MKVSLRFAQWHSNVELMPAGIDELVTKIGAQLGAVDEVTDFGARYGGVVVARVVSCKKHPNADKLQVCALDDGGVVKNVSRDSKGLVEVVCGAPNVAEGQTVAWIPPGVTVPSTYGKNPFTLESKELRGVVSNGMIASSSELGINDDHGGIVVIDKKDVGEELMLPGTPFRKLYGLDDVVIDIENKMFTHRPDCFGVLGVAREIAGIQGLEYKSPDWYREDAQPKLFKEQDGLALEVDNQLPKLAPRFVMVPIKDVRVEPSPLWLQAGLARVGIRPINNIVDITNYVMYLTGQPLHAYDYDKLVARAPGGTPKIIIRSPNDSEKLTMLNGKTVDLEAEATIVIADAAGPIGLGGVMGGHDTEVDESTTNIVLECANFDMYTIRRMSMKYGIFSDAVTRFNKGQSFWQNIAVINYAIEQIQKLAHGRQAGPVLDTLSKDHTQKVSRHDNVTVTGDFIRSRLGFVISDKDMAQLLKNVEFEVHHKEGSLTVKPPFWRTDIEIEEDVVEEVARLYGFDHLPLDLPLRSILPALIDPKLACKATTRRLLSSLGANEVLTYTFVHSDLLLKAGQDVDLAFQLSNALSPELQYYRLSLIPSLLQQVHPNIKAGHDRFALFELGKVHSTSEIDDSGIPREFGRLGLVYADNRKGQRAAAYFHVKQYVSKILQIQHIPFKESLLGGHKLLTQMTKPFDTTRSALLWDGKKVVGIVGEFTSSVQRAFKLPPHAAGFEVFLSTLADGSQSSYLPLSKFPSVNADITYEIPSSMNFGELAAAFEEALTQARSSDQEVSWRPLDIFSSPELAGKKRITFRIKITSRTHTLTDKTVSEVLDDASQRMSKTIPATRI